MPFCENCGTKLDDGSLFCTSCGTKVGSAGSGAAQSAPSQSPAPGAAVPASQRIGKPIPSSATKQDWFDPYSAGRARAMDSVGIEEWKYDRGNVTCTEGNYRNRKYTWDGASFTPEDSSNPRGEFNASTGSLKWFVKRRASFGGGAAAAGNDDILLHEYTFDENTGELENVKGIARVEPVRFVSYTHWKATGETRRGGTSVQLKVAENAQGADTKEGASTWWDLSNFPLPIGLFVAMYTRTEQILEEAELRAKRVYKNCGSLVLASTDVPKLCGLCAEDGGANRCLVCEADLATSGKNQGSTCKTCASKRAFCWKCGDRVGAYGPPTEGFLCDLHGLGKAGKNCCKRVYTIPRTAQY